MILAFGESIFILGVLGLVLFCIAVIGYILSIIIRRKKLRMIHIFIALTCSLPLVVLSINWIKVGNVEYNPSGVTADQIAGKYVSEERILIMNENFSYESSNLTGIPKKGKWSFYDWNLTLSGAELDKPRWIIRNGVPEILPYYKGVESSDGVALKKQN